MMASTEIRPEDVGDVLIKVQEDLSLLREQLLNKAKGDGSTNNIDVSHLDSAIQKTEEGLKSKMEVVLHQLNNRVLTVPSLESHRTRGQNVTIETTYDLKQPSKTATLPSKSAMQERSFVPRDPARITQKVIEQKIIGKEVQTSGITPAQQFKANLHNQIIANPYNPKNRETLNENYGIQLPLINNRGLQRLPGHQIKGSTVEPLAVLPKANRIDPQLLPPPIKEEDARLGILSLIQRGLIPKAAELTLEPSPVHHKTATLHPPKEKDGLRQNEGRFSTAVVKWDPTVRPEDLKPRPKSVTSMKTPVGKNQAGTGNTGSAVIKVRTPVSIKTIEIHPLPPPTTPSSFPENKERRHRFPAQNGKIKEDTPEFAAFKQHYVLSWGSIVTMLRHLQKMLSNYSIPVAFINGDKLADLAIECELQKAPSNQDLLSVIANRDDVESAIIQPGRRYSGPKGDELAAAKIQATWRMFQERVKYLDYRQKKWAAGVIAISWIMNVKMSRVRRQLHATRSDQLENFRRRAKILAKNWDRLQNSRRVIIHIPSLGYSGQLRNTVTNFNLIENLQMARLCDVKDPNVDVIYVSPVPVNEEMEQYYAKLLGLKPAIDTGSVDDQTDLTSKYKIIVPDAIKSFPAHNMCLSTLMKYSPRTLRRIKNLIRGREAYMITAVPHVDDLHVADVLDVPLLAPEPDIAHLFSIKSGSKRIFASAGVAMPPGWYDIYSLPQLHECLAQLITENLEVKRWLFKLDDEFDGRGIAYIDVAQHMPCYQWAVKEAQRYGEKWSKKWAQEAAYIKIHAEIPEVLNHYAKPANTRVYPTWEKYREAFLTQGGIIEACPPPDSVTALTVDMLIEPTGRISIKCMGDQIHAQSPYNCWGLSVPQSSVEPEQLNESCMKIAEACRSRGIIGYMSIDFVTFIHPKNLQQLLWAIDLDLAYSDSMALFTMMEFITNGRLDTKNHYFDIPLPRKEERKSRRRRSNLEEDGIINTNRYAVMSTRLKHTNLSVVHYSVFFQMCRAHGIGYDIKEKQGSVFTLVDSFDRENLGMLTVGDSLQGALATFARNLSVIHQEISAPNMQGESNFKPVIEDIEAILGTTVENADDESEDAVTESES